VTASKLTDTRERLFPGLSLAEVAIKFKTPPTTWRNWETEIGQNARRVPGIIEVALMLYEQTPKGKRPL